MYKRQRYDRAGENGFGYDPLFVPDEEDFIGAQGRTAAQLSADEKDRISHRGKALEQLVPYVAELAGQA